MLDLVCQRGTSGNLDNMNVELS